MTGRYAITIIRVTIEDRPDGGINVTSKTLPGLILSGENRDRIIAMIEPAIKALLNHRGIEVISVKPYRPIETILGLPSPRDVEIAVAHTTVREFAVEILEREAA
jgi:hypothetical protein